MLRFLRLFAQLLVLVIVALAAALISMRLAIHGREVSVPDLRGLPPAQAERLASEKGLEFACSDRFYSANVPAGRIVSQQPDPGSRVRRGWRVQAAESLGPQISDIPALIGMSSRAAEIDIRRRGLEIGAAAELPTANAQPEAIIAQSPSPGAQSVASPRVSLLYAAPPLETAYAMPDLSGMTLAEATELINKSGLKALSITTTNPNSNSPSTTEVIVTGQTPAAGSRVTPGTNVSLQVTRT